MDEVNRTFLHFFDVHFLREKVGNDIREAVRNEARLATRMAVLWSDEVIIPMASYFESEMCKYIIDEHIDLLDMGVIILAGNAESIGEFFEKKIASYSLRSNQSKSYRKAKQKRQKIPFITRQSSATFDIRTDWCDVLYSNRLGQVLEGCGLLVNTDFENNWEQLPERLEMKAFTPPHALSLLNVKKYNRIFEHKISNLINASYFSSFTRDWGAGIVDELVYLGAGYSVASYGANIPYRVLMRVLREYGMLERVVTVSLDELLAIKKDTQWALVKQKTQHQYQLLKGYRPHTGENDKSMKIFIVHGHDHGLVYELKDYLQNTLGFEEPIVLMQQPNRGRTIIEKFEDHADEVDAAVVLLTPDDFGALHGDSEKNRARQNVIFELGYFVGKFGRKEGRTILMTSGEMEIPSDLQGVIYIDITNGIASSGEKIRGEFAAI